MQGRGGSARFGGAVRNERGSGELADFKDHRTVGEKPVEGEIQEDVCGEQGAVKKDERCQGQQVAKGSSARCDAAGGNL
jgi:hypothetical protein